MLRRIIMSVVMVKNVAKLKMNSQGEIIKFVSFQRMVNFKGIDVCIKSIVQILMMLINMCRNNIWS